MNPNLLIISLLGLACTINGQGTDSTKPIANVPKPPNQLTLDDLPSPQELEAGMAALNRASVKSTQDLQSAIQNQMEAELLRNEMKNKARAARINFPPPPEARSTQLLPTGLPRPTDMGASTSRSSGTQADGQISVGNIQVVYNDELRTIMRDYNITPEEIKKMLELYAKGGEATITKQRTNPENGLQEIVTLDFENFTSQRPGPPITSVSPAADILPVPGSTSPPVDPLQDFLSTEAYLQEQIKELDAQFDALNAAYQQGTISRQTRNENAMINRDSRRRFETDLRAIQMEISRRTGGEKTEPEVPLINRVDDGEFFGNGQTLGPKPFILTPPKEVTETGEKIVPSSADLRELERQNQRLVEILRRMGQGGRPGRSGLGIDQTRFGIQDGSLPLRGQPPLTGRPRPGGQLPSQLPRYMTPEQRAALRRELLNIRRREQLIFQQLSQLRNRNPQLLLPNVRDPFRQQLRRRVSFSNGNRPQLTRTLSGSVTGQDVPRRRVV